MEELNYRLLLDPSYHSDTYSKERELFQDMICSFLVDFYDNDDNMGVNREDLSESSAGHWVVMTAGPMGAGKLGFYYN